MRQEVGHYSIQQPSAKILRDDGKIYYFVNLNEREIQQQSEYSDIPYTEYEYDINHFIVPEEQEQIDEADFMAHPEKYLNYEVPAPKTLEEQLTDLQAKLRADIDYIAMMTEVTL